MKYESTLTDVAKAWRNGELSKPESSSQKRFYEIVAKNGGTSIIKAGYPVQITRFTANVSYDKAYRKLINGDLTVTVRYSGTHAYTLEPIPPGRYGRIGGVFYGIVTYSNTSHEYCDEEFNSCASGPIRIIAYVGRANNKSVCVLKRLGGGGGGTGTPTFTNVVDSVTESTTNVVGSLATTTATVADASSVITGATLATNVSGGIQVPTAIDCSNGVMTITWDSIGVTTTSGTAQGISVLASVTPTAATVVSGVTTSTTSVVEDIT